MEKISWTNRLRNEEDITWSHGGEEYCTYNKSLLKCVTEGKIKGSIKVTGRRRRRKRLLMNLRKREDSVN